MSRAVTGLVLVALAGFAGGCSRQDEPPPKYNTVLEHGSEALAPVPLMRPDVEGLPPVSSARYLRKIGGASGASAAVAPEGGGTAPPEGGQAIVLNDADAEALIRQFAEMARIGNIEVVTQMFVPDQQPLVRRTAASAKAIEEAVKRLHDALASADPDLARQFQPNEAGLLVLKSPDGADLPAVSLRPVFEVVGIEAQGEDQATATLKLGDAEKKFQMTRVDGKWRISHPDIAGNPQMAGRMAGIAAALGRELAALAEKVEKNEVQPADVTREVLAAAKRAASAPPSDEGQGADAAAEAKPADGEPQPADAAGGAGARTAGPQERPRRTRSGRDVDNEAPTLEESLGRQ